MRRRDAHHPSRSGRRGSRLAFWLPVLLVLAVLGAAGTAYHQDWSLAGTPADPRQPTAVSPTPAVDLPALTSPSAVAAGATGEADPAKVRRALAPLLGDGDLGPHVLATVAGLDGTLLYSTGTGVATPASTLKLLTATAALAALGPGHTFATTVVADPGQSGPRRVVLVGGGDPLLDKADLRRLARQTAAALTADGVSRVSVGYDTSLFTGPEASPHWPGSYLSEGVVSPITSLWIDEGRDESGYGRVADPAATAASTYAAALAAAGIAVRGAPRPRQATAGSTELARVESATLAQLVEHTVSTSDNEAAEVLARQTAIAADEPASFAGGARAVRDTLADLGIPTGGVRIFDGSGLSRDNRLDPDVIAAVLETASADDHPELRAVVTGLAVAGFSGSLTERFTETADRAGRGVVRAKTGTLTGVSALAGIVTDRTGALMVFALMADRIDVADTLEARAALDAAASALAGCRCGAAGSVTP